MQRFAPHRLAVPSETLLPSAKKLFHHVRPFQQLDLDGSVLLESG